jgi:hypothetical protein
MGLLYGRAGRLTAENAGFAGQRPNSTLGLAALSKAGLQQASRMELI